MELGLISNVGKSEMVLELRIRNELNTDAAMVITNDGVKQIDFTKLYNDQLGSMETGRFQVETFNS